MTDEASKEETKKVQATETCFIITPIGDENSIIRRKTDGLINNVIKPVCEKLNFKAIPAHEIDKPGSITSQVIRYIMDSKIVIANLTGLNPNVMYELAIRHAAKLPVICLAEEGTKLPFDITTERTIFYCDDMSGAVLLKPVLEKKIKAALNDENIDNPIYRSIQEEQIIKNIKSSNHEDSDYLLYIIDRLDQMDGYLRKEKKNKYISQSTPIEYNTIITVDQIDYDDKDLMEFIASLIPFPVKILIDKNNNTISIYSSSPIDQANLQSLAGALYTKSIKVISYIGNIKI